MKKIITVIVSAILLVQSFSVSAFTSNTAYPDDIDILEKKLTALDVVSPGNHEADDLITRGEFVEAVIKLFNISSSDGNQIFYDVDENNSAFNAVYTAYKLGVISVTEDRIFNPGANITYNEAVKILVSMLGYSAKAEVMGGFPTGYSAVANQLKIGLKQERNGITYYNMLAAFNNAIEIDIPAMGTINNGYFKYEVDKGRNLLSEYLDIYCDEGMVEAVGSSSLYGGESLLEDKTVIDGKEYGFLFEDMPDFVGCTVKFYYRGKDKTVLYAALVDDSDVLEISADDIEGYKDGVYTYYRSNGKKSLAKVSSTPFVMYNGKIAEGKITNMYTPEIGGVRLVDSNSNGVYDVVIIKEYTTYIVGGVDAENSIIYDKFDSSKQLCFDESKGIDAKITTEAGKDVFVGVISEWSVVSALVSEDGKYVRAVISTKCVSGTVNSYTKNGGEKHIEIDDVDYCIGKNMEQSSALSELRVGSVVSCYLNHEGKVSAISYKSSSEYQYFVLLQYAEKSAINKQIMIQVMNSDNEIVEFTLSDNTKIDSVHYKNFEDMYAALENSIKSGYVVRIKFSGSSIYDIDTPFLSDKECKDSSLTPYMDKTQDMLYKSSGNVEDTFFLTDDTFIVFEYPNETEIQNKFYISDRGRLINDTKYTISAFAIGDTFAPQAVIIQQSNTFSRTVTDRTLYVVEEISRVNDSKGDAENKLTVNSGAETKILYVNDECIKNLRGLNRGDIIRADIYKDNYVLGNYISKVYDYETDTVIDENLTKSSTNASIAVRIGYVYDKIDSYISYLPENNISDIESSDRLVVNLPSNMLKISKKRDDTAVEAVSNSDIKDYKTFGEECSKILIKYQYRVPYQLIIIEH